MRIACAAILTIGAMTAPAMANAQGGSPPSPRREEGHPRYEDAVLFLAGAAAGFGAHEMGHVLGGLTFGAHPRVKRIEYGVIPFFAIDHDTVSRRREFVISSAGFWVQHAGSEWVLTTHPHLRDERAPVLKGVLAFNLAASAVYSTAAFGRFGPPERDTLGIAVSMGPRGTYEPVVGALILAPAVLDGIRYLRPDARWAVWTSRAAKIAAVVLVVR